MRATISNTLFIQINFNLAKFSDDCICSLYITYQITSYTFERNVTKLFTAVHQQILSTYIMP